MKLTAETITNEQLREFKYQSVAGGNFQVACEALGEACIWFAFDGFTGYRFPTEFEKHEARARCAAILNARAK